MLVIRKTTLKRVVLAALIVLVLAGVLTGAILAAEEKNAVVIDKKPIKTDEAVYVELNGDGIHSPEELVGVFDVYDGNKALKFKWDPYPFAADENGSYRISLWQNTTPFEPVPTWAELKVSHHWADNPNGTEFKMGAFGFGEDVCVICPTMIVVMPETYVLVQDPVTTVYEYVYTLVEDTPMLTSELFIIEIFRPSEGCVHPWLTIDLRKECKGICGNDEACIDDCVEGLKKLAEDKNFSDYYDDYYWDEAKEKCVCGLSNQKCAEKGKQYNSGWCVCE
jgi:hypothetical protein